MGTGGGPLSAWCTWQWPGFPTGGCAHELTPPLIHGNLRWFSQRLTALPDNLIVQQDGTIVIDPASKPLWNFVIVGTGEIVIGSEDYGWIKHTCLAGGLQVWSAGQIAIENNQVRLVDLQSGHYVRPNVGPGTPGPPALSQDSRTSLCLSAAFITTIPRRRAVLH